MSNLNPVEEGIRVKLPSGTEWRVLTRGEVNFVKERSRLYMETFKFTNVSDLAGLDQVIQLELIIHRLASNLSLGRDYFGGELPDEGGMRRQLKDLSTELRQLKASLRLDRTSRAQDDTTDFVSYLDLLRARAHAFGIKRDEETAKAIELMNQALALAQLYMNTTEQERKEMRCTAEDIVHWLHTDAREQFTAIDKHFREVNQHMWFPVTGEGL